jgi:WD40 repeat protein
MILADGVTGRNGIVRVLAVNSGVLAESWRAHEDGILDLELSRDGSQLATAGGDKLIKVWELASKKELTRLEGHTAQVLGVAFNTNATQIVSSGADRELRVWEIETRQKIGNLGKHAAAVTAVCWPGDGKIIVAITEAGAVVTYKNLKSHTGRERSESGDERKLGEADGALLSVAAAPDGKTVFAGTHEGTIYVWSSKGTLLAKLAPSIEARTVTGTPAFNTPRTSSSKKIKAFPRSRDRLQPVGNVSSLTAEPQEITLSGDAPRHGVLVTAKTGDGFEIDATRDVKFSTSRAAPFKVTRAGEVYALRPGHGILTASFKGKRVQIPVKVQSAAQPDSDPALAPAPISFVRDVLPALSRAGCNAGGCHAKPEGQNGFRLSVFSYDPASDYAEIVKEARGRRIFPAAPDESLIIKKPTTALPHEGGLRFERGSETHQLLARWLREGMPYSLTNEPVLQRIIAFPKERRYHKGASQQLLVQAQYSDGSVRDVTRLAKFDSNDKEIASADEHGLITVGTLTGQGVIVARYMGFVADSHVLVPADRLLPETQYASLPKHNFIDELAYAHFQELGLFPSELCADAEFLRRAYLDSVGVLPTSDEVREFLSLCGEEGKRTQNDQSPSAFAATGAQHARRALIARLLDRPEYADYWANKWADLLRPNPDRVGVKSVFVLDQWLRESFRANKPYDQFVREILLAEGSNHRDGPAVIYRDRREPADLTTMFSQLFLGARLECAKCHHHPNEKWSQDDFYQFAAFFGPVKRKGAGLSPPISAGTETFYFAPGRQVKHPVTGLIMSPRPPDGTLAELSEDLDPRRALADWLMAPDNPFFARAAVNRIWAVFFGRGLVEPVDDFRISNPCVNPPLLAALAEDFVKHDYDLKHLIRTIMESRLYQLSSTPNEFNLADTRNFSRSYRRRLPAEVLLDAVNDATGVPDRFAAMPIGSRATQAWSYKVGSQFMDAFGRPNPSSDCPCERDTQMSVVQSLHLMNSKSLQSKLSNKAGRARRLAESNKSPDEIVTELYLATLSRPPTDEELSVATAAFTASEASRQSATEDVFWALLNSAEFVFNH